MVDSFKTEMYITIYYFTNGILCDFSLYFIEPILGLFFIHLCKYSSLNSYFYSNFTDIERQL